jgi:hypothetical protein
MRVRRCAPLFFAPMRRYLFTQLPPAPAIYLLSYPAIYFLRRYPLIFLCTWKTKQGGLYTDGEQAIYYIPR